MSAESLWGEIPQTGTLRTPIAILREQAGVLGARTNNVLEGDVLLSRRGSKFSLRLQIVAPALDNYRLEILSVEHEMTLYPLEVTDLMSDGLSLGVECKDEAAFKSALKEILSSNRVHRALESLLSQSQAA